MIQSIDIKNFGPIADFSWHDLAPINLLIGRNGTGKTFLLKALYCAVRTLEEKQGDEPRSYEEILAEKLYWTFQPDKREKIGDLVRQDTDSGLSVRIMLKNPMFAQKPPQPLSFSFDSEAGRGDLRFESRASLPPARANSIFLPAKEMLSLYQLILRSRDQYRLFGFDDTYVDLARALQWQPDAASVPKALQASMAELEGSVGGRVESVDAAEPRDLPAEVWRFKGKGQDLAIGMGAEGARKVASLDRLLRNGHLGRWSIVFVDEPESALHPEAISRFLDVIVALADLFGGDIQFFLASHSYFVVKKLYLIAQEKGMSIPVAMAEDDRWATTDLKDGMPSNPIIDESIRLYKEEVELTLK